MNNDQNQISWDARSQKWGASLRSVLFKGFPETINRHLDAWQQGIVLENLGAAKHLRVLDLGCGYGRLAEAIIQRFPAVELTGVDISDHYLALFRERTGRTALSAHIENLPPSLKDFHRLVCVTVLMYVDQKSQTKAVDNMLGALQIGGRLILLENDRSGLPFLTGCGLLKNRGADKESNVHTGGVYFSAKQIKELLHRPGVRLSAQHRMPATTVAILPLVAAGRYLPRRWTQKALRLVRWLDARLEQLPLPSLYTAYIVEKES